ncbi:MAG: hypothetical protein HKN05_08950 [Rhizobiales bacterium]|nr:hypothetical protein [Hyphomicrobiales bacterium]
MAKVVVLFSTAFIERHGYEIVSLTDLGLEIAQNIEFKPNDPEASDSELRRYYTAEVEFGTLAQELVNQLLGLAAVEAAWVKADEGPPG